MTENNLDEKQKERLLATWCDHVTRLVAIPSTSADTKEHDLSTLNVIAYIEAVLIKAGFSTERLEARPGHVSLYAFKGEPLILLSGHVDTVPCNADAWQSDPFTLTLREGRAYGLGACDMKGFIALMLTLAASTAGDNLALLFTSDEETDMAGALKAVEHLKGRRFSLIVIGEPTGNVPVTAHKGWMYREYRTQGKAAHSSHPELGESAIEKGLTVLNALYALRDRFKVQSDVRGQYPTLNVGRVTGGDAANRVPDTFTVIFDVRPTPYVDVAKVKESLSALPGDGVLHAPFADIAPLKDTLSPALLALLERLTGTPCQSVAYCTEGSLLQSLGPCVILGPGSIAQAHQVDEWIEISEVRRALHIFTELLRTLNRPNGDRP